MAPVRVAIAGSTGSIGTQTLDVIRAEGPERYDVVALGVGSSVDALIEQAKEFRPAVVAVADERSRALVGDALADIEVVAHQHDLVEPADVVINGVVGFAGLSVTIETLRAGKRLGLANKESLIAAGPVVQPLRATPGADLVPVDSEHCAIHQCLRSSNDGSEVVRIVLTASGGPFRGRTSTDMESVTVDEALQHPTWSMGPKITIDSATLANKGLEIIEAHHLFGLDYDSIDVVIHPQSIVHGMIECVDGTLLAELGKPDMRAPIRAALTYPRRVPSDERMAVASLGALTFEAPDPRRFPALALARAAGVAGGTAPAVFNAANETAVAAFLARRIMLLDIPAVCEQVLDDHEVAPAHSIDVLLAADRWAREQAAARVSER